jgi:DNA-binding Xre family transcriptional regulator
LPERKQRTERGAISVKLEKETHEKLAHLAADRGVTMRALLSELITRAYSDAPPKATTKPKRSHPRKITRWTQSTVVQEIRAREKASKAVTSWKVQLEDAGLYEGGCRVYGSWNDALKAAGIDVPDRSAGVPARGLQRLRLQRGLSQAELAKKSGTSQSHVSQLEALNVHPTKLMLAALAHGLSCSPRELLLER